MNVLIERLCQNDIAIHYPSIYKLAATPEQRIESLSIKLRRILTAFATGATVSKDWNNYDEANGGFIVVTEDGNVVGLSLSSRKDIGDYLLNWTRFDNPDRNRHKHNQVIIDKTEQRAYIKLQLQVRFLKHPSVPKYKQQPASLNHSIEMLTELIKHNSSSYYDQTCAHR